MELNLPQGARVENLEVEGEDQQQFQNFEQFVKMENNKILYTLSR